MWMKSVDTDGDGTISKAEADALFNRIDTNHDGKLDKSEMAAYRKALMEQRRAEMQKELDAKFKAADKNGDGALTKDEVNAGLPRLAKHFDQLDANHDGKLTQDESRPACRRCTRSACSACRAAREHRQRPERLPAAAAEPADPRRCPDSGQGWCRRATFNGSRFFLLRLPARRHRHFAGNRPNNRRMRAARATGLAPSLPSPGRPLQTGSCPLFHCKSDGYGGNSGPMP